MINQVTQVLFIDYLTNDSLHLKKRYLVEFYLGLISNVEWLDVFFVYFKVMESHNP